MIDFALILEQLPTLLGASLNTISLTVLSLALASALGLPLAIIRQSKTPAARVVAAYSWFLLAMPELLLLFLAYYGLPSVGIVLPAYPTAVLALGITSSAYNLEIFRAGIISIPRGQFEAARALGLSEARVWWRIVLPQALAVITPPYVSNATLALKGTSVAAVITVPELTSVGMGIIGETLRPLDTLVGVAVIYLALNSVLTGLQGAVERRLSRRS
jgi:His/Glu/Gln/Arg/opine family amino acid ABC transporter permease subunit